VSQEEPAFHVKLPPEQEAGAYAHGFFIWSTAYEFNLDFAVRSSVDYTGGDQGFEMRVIARVRLPPPLAFELIRSINTELEGYEQRWGTIRRLGTSEETEP
jgi:Protein of unknown function (DUF3467)